MFGKQNPSEAWRMERIVLSACLRSLHEYAYTQLLDASGGPSHGGPPE